MTTRLYYQKNTKKWLQFIENNDNRTNSWGTTGEGKVTCGRIFGIATADIGTVETEILQCKDRAALIDAVDWGNEPPNIPTLSPIPTGKLIKQELSLPRLPRDLGLEIDELKTEVDELKLKMDNLKEK